MTFKLKKPTTPPPLTVEPSVLVGNPILVELALEHALLWCEWHKLHDACDRKGADLVLINKQMIRVRDHMADVFGRFRAALKKELRP